MALSRAFIPYRAYWSSPFCRWQGALANEHSLSLAAQTATSVLKERGIAPADLDGVTLGMSVPQRGSFYGAPWLSGLFGADRITGPTVSQACATSARVIASMAMEVETGQAEALLGVTCDRTSNGPHIYYPDPSAPGGRGATEDWVWDNFSRDPYAKNAMIETAERVAKTHGFSREAQDEVALLRHQQYATALANDRAFQRRYMAKVLLRRGKKEVAIDADDGVHPTTAEGLRGLRPLLEGGTVTFGSQTHPADGNAGLVVATKERAAVLASDAKVTIAVRAFGQARVEKGRMPEAVVPAAQVALSRAGIAIADCKVIKTHNPFAVNDLFFAKEMGVALDGMNRFGSPLIFGHPQGPTGSRLVIEMIEELVDLGGGHGLFSGCAAGDTAMAVVVEVA